METSDEMLAKAAQTGDAQAFATLVDRNYDRIFRIGWRVLGSRHAAEDLAQDVCAALPAKLASYRADARFSTWLYTVALNAARDRLRRRATRTRAAMGWGDHIRHTRAAEAEDREDQAWLAQAMTYLPDDLRETVALILGEDMTHAQAATVLGVSEGTVSWRMSQVKQRLRAMAQETL